MTGPSRLGISVVLPTIDERANLERLVPGLLDLPDVVEVIVVDDGSRDGTREWVAARAAADPRVRLITRAAPPSLPRSIAEGVAAAKGDLVAWLDADGSMLPADLARLAAEVRAGADLAIGSRFVDRGRIKGQTRDGFLGRLAALDACRRTPDRWYGVLFSWGLNAVLLPVVLGRGVHDYTSGFVVARREALDGFEFGGGYGEYFVELWEHAARRGLRVAEVGYAIQPRGAGRSKTASSLVGFLRRGLPYVTTAARLRRERGR